MSKDLRIRFDDAFDELMDALRDTNLFSDNSEVAMFAGALGLKSGLHVERAKGSRDVRLTVLMGTPGGLEFCDLVALQLPESKIPDPLSDEGIEEKLALIEGCVNGGLSMLLEILKSGRSLHLAILEIYGLALQDLANEKIGGI